MGERALVHFALSVMLTHATSPRVRGLIMMRTLNIGESKTLPYNIGNDIVVFCDICIFIYNICAKHTGEKVPNT